jgi:hypothetical protein
MNRDDYGSVSAEANSAGHHSLIREYLADWYITNPRIRGACAYAIREVGDVEGSEIYVLIDVEPAMDSEETLPVWLAHCDAWQRELKARTACKVHLERRASSEAPVASWTSGRAERQCIEVWSSRNLGDEC